MNLINDILVEIRILSKDPANVKDYSRFHKDGQAFISLAAPVIRKLVVLKGELERGRFVEHISLKGLAFQHNQELLPRAGYAPYQAAYVTEAAIMADGPRVTESVSDPFATLRKLLHRYRLDARAGGDERFPFRAGAVGWIGYESGQFIERLPCTGAK